MRLTVSFAIGYDGTAKRYSEKTLVFVSYVNGASIAYRKHSLGINIEEPGEADVLTIQQFGNSEDTDCKRYVRFLGTYNSGKVAIAKEFYIDLATGTVYNFTIDCGDW